MDCQSPMTRVLSVILLGGITFLLQPGVLALDPFISEFLAVNDSTLLDEDGDASDWIEIHNPCAEPVDLDGWYLTDDPADLTRWRFPPRILEPGSYLVVFASGKDRRSSELHTDFRLSSDGDYLGLIRPDGSTVVSEFAPAYPPQRADISFGLGQRILDDSFVAQGDAVRMIVPVDGSLGERWTGSASEEPFDDSAAAGWSAATIALGYQDGEDVTPASFPLVYWSFDLTGRDLTGNGHDATLNGATFSDDVAGVIGSGQSLSFDGIDDFVSAVVDVSETRYTSSMWFRTSRSSRGLFTVVENDLGGGGHDRHLYLSGRNVAARVWNNETISSSGRNFADGSWHHVAHVVGSEVGGQRIYVDGELVASGSQAASDFNWQERVNIGFSNDATANFFLGWIDDVAIWDDVLTVEQIRALAAGALPLALDGLRPLIATDVGGEMRGVNGSVQVRIPFETTLPPVEAFDALQLHVRYDDGFVAYLNGSEVARRNAPEQLFFDSTALVDRPLGQAIRGEVIDISAHLSLLRDGANILAVWGLNDAVDSREFLVLPELVKVESRPDLYLSPPTPGAPNVLGLLDFVADTRFSIDRGFYSEPFEVEITSATEGVSIYYTTDGSEPGPENPVATLYSGPVPISTTTTLRAAAFREGFQPTNVDTQTYVFIGHVRRQPALPPGVPSRWSGGFPADYEVDPDVVRATLPGYSLEAALLDIPTLSVVTDPENLFDPRRGIYYHSTQRGPGWERPTSIELIYPDGRAGFQVDAGIRMHGNSSRIHTFTSKHSMRLLFKSKYGPKKLRFRLFADSSVDRFDQLVLRGSSTDSWPVVNGSFVLGVQRWHPVHATYMRDQWMRDAQIAMGRPSAHGTYVHLYLNGLYWGQYNLSERPTDSFNAEHLGGEKEEYDVVKDFAELQSGRRDAWNAMITMAGAGLGSASAYQRIQGYNPDGTRNPGFPRYLDVDNLIDYMVLHIYAGAEDWPDHNWWAGRRRGPASDGFQFFAWDQEISNDSLVRTHTRIRTRFEAPIGSPTPSFLYGRLMANPAFRQKFVDRVHQHLFNGGLLSPEGSHASWVRRQSEMDRSIVAESARWGDSKKSIPYKREVEWLNEHDWMRERYWPEVHPIAVQRFRNVGLYPDLEAPSFEIEGQPQHGGVIRPGDRLTMVVPVSERFIDVPFVERESFVSAYVPASGDLGDLWLQPGYVEGSRGETWTVGTNGVGYENGSGYESVIHIDVGAEMSGEGGNNSVYVRLPFTIDNENTIASLDRLTLRIAFDDGFVAYLNGTRVVEANAPADLDWDSVATTGGETSIEVPPEFDLTDSLVHLEVGENLLTIHGLNFNTSSSDMLILAELIGATLDDAPQPGSVFYTLDSSDPRDPGALTYDGPIPLAGTTVVSARAFDGNEWSALNRATYFVDLPVPLRVTEIMYHPPQIPGETLFNPEDFEFVELQNVGDSTLLLEGIQFIDGIGFDFSRSEVATLAPREILVIVKNLEAFSSRYEVQGMNIAGEYEGRLSNAGELLILRGPLGDIILHFTYIDDWYPSTDGEGHSLVIRDPFASPESWGLSGSWSPSPVALGTPGVADGDLPSGGLQRPGDANQDGVLDLSDAISLLLRLFRDPSPPPCEGSSLGEGGNLLLLDANGDAGVDLSDAVHLLGFLFQGGPAPALGASCRFIEGCPDVCGL